MSTKLSYTDMKRTVLDAEGSRSSGFWTRTRTMGQARSRFVVCVQSDAAEDLEVRKVYRILPDEAASARGHLRVIDESGEDYLYPEVWFVPN